MTPWQEFYFSIRDPAWPDCDTESEFGNLPKWIQRECREEHGYQPGQYARQSALPQRVFPIKSETACQLKWNWSTLYLFTEKTASCHRTNHHTFDSSTFNFHNTPEKIADRERMLRGEWPDRGCEYCRNIEDAGGQSDRITNLDFPGVHAPVELDTDPMATTVTPRILEVYFDNTCNLKCVYCGPSFSSLWHAENVKFNNWEETGFLSLSPTNPKSQRIEENKEKLFAWLQNNVQHLTNFNILGGEPLYQREFDRCLELFDQCPAPNLDLQIYTNLNTTPDRLMDAVERVNQLIQQRKLKNFTVTASLDCWGPAQEYARFPLNLESWEHNFNLLLAQPWIKLIIGSTITPLTVKTLPELMQKIQQWRRRRPVYQYFNSVNSPSHMFIDIYGNRFLPDFEQCYQYLDASDPDQATILNYLKGIAQQSASCGENSTEINNLHRFLDELDHRRGTSWKTTFPWLVDQK